MISLVWDHVCDHSVSPKLSAEKHIWHKPVSSLLTTCSKVSHKLISQVSQPGLVFVMKFAHFSQRLKMPLFHVVLHCYYAVIRACEWSGASAADLLLSAQAYFCDTRSLLCSNPRPPAQCSSPAHPIFCPLHSRSDLYKVQIITLA